MNGMFYEHTQLWWWETWYYKEGKVLGAKSGEWGQLASLYHFGFTHTAIQPTNTQYNKCYLKAQSSSKFQKNVTKIFLAMAAR